MDRNAARAARKAENEARLADALLAAHSEAHDLIRALAAKVDGIDPDAADGWGGVASLNYINARLREALGIED